MNPQDRALWGLRPCVSASKARDMLALEDFAKLFRNEVLNMVSAFLADRHYSFAGFKGAWKAHGLSRMYQIDFASVARPEIVHMMLREALGLLVESILACRHGTREHHDQYVVDALRLKVLGHTFTLYTVYQCQSTPIKQKILLDIESAMHISLAQTWCDAWGVLYPDASHEAQAMLVRLDRDHAFLRCMHGYNWVRRTEFTAPPPAEPDEIPEAFEPFEPLEFDLALKHLHASYQEHMKPFRPKPGAPSARLARPTIRIPTMPPAPQQDELDGFMDKFEKTFEEMRATAAAADLVQGMNLEALAFGDLPDEDSGDELPAFDVVGDSALEAREMHTDDTVANDDEVDPGAEHEPDDNGIDNDLDDNGIDYDSDDNGIDYDPGDSGINYDPGNADDDSRRATDAAAPPVNTLQGEALQQLEAQLEAELEAEPERQPLAHGTNGGDDDDDDVMGMLLSDGSDSDVDERAPSTPEVAAQGLVAMRGGVASTTDLAPSSELTPANASVAPEQSTAGALSMDADLSLSVNDSADAPTATASTVPLADDQSSPTRLESDAELSLSDDSDEAPAPQAVAAPASTSPQRSSADQTSIGNVNLDADLSLSDDSDAAPAQWKHQLGC
ncbi:hypothetical protein SPRG_08323 [Saprolegnia parasitica CBS 223.65]|uniref:Uncharacterized protein n=1 Tax=Saprolegnia parasitica (strain CBS 223.65) TaxID=695850 RepID=A0A067C6Z1_SAPPC|nr:hypothetical protein SPRG_08323 [Saprolegnia parasitica CBS 223.65]KDO26248.1 hypothetical protein SPRG_08323 [Saprolegnia parasitica CBS 223.65]|eukprot:XP_012202957.1 hypothetical protein SPRG_08323 [Saprolegnia parasitica CBS 223.65]